MGTTLEKKGEVKTSVRTKKVAAVKRVIKKPAPKKPAEAKAKPAAKAVRKRTTARTRKQVSELVENPDVVFVPSTASLRLLEKVQLYSIWYERTFPGAMSTVAKVGGYAFILLGTVFAVSSYIDTKNVVSNPAALVCTETSCVNIPDEELPSTVPKITFINSIPSTLTSDTDFKITATNTESPIIHLTALETGSVITLTPTEKIGETEYRFLIPGGRLAAGSYVAKAEAQHDRSTYTFVGPTFLIVSKELPTVVPAEVTSAALFQADSVSEVLIEELETEAETSTADEVSAVLADEELVVESVTEEEATVDESLKYITTSSALSPILISLHEESSSTYLKIKTADFTPSRVDVYSQIHGSGQPLYLGKATLVQSEWVFSVSALSLPLTTHYLYASFTVAGKTYQSEAVLHTPIKTTTTNPNTEADLAILVQKIELALLASSVNNENRRRYFDYFAAQPETLFVESEELQFADKRLLTIIDSAMRSDSESLQPLLLRFAAAIQAESDFNVALSSAALTAHYTKLASTIASTIGDSAAVPAIHTVLALRYQVLKDKIRETEEQIRQETNHLTSRDSDQDGISDFDEVANFGTNPLLADTDIDGVIDTVEISRGSDPLVADAKKVPHLNRNIEEVTFDEVVEINFVGPQVTAMQDAASDEFYIRVEGRSVPGSHVYLLSYSTGVVGVVRTGSSGMFSYTIERDFAVGQHELAAVLVDTEGVIVASSKPHRFARTTNSFIAAAAMGATETQGTQSAEDTIVLNVLVAAIGVITFGFVLLLLSNTLRNRRSPKQQPA